MSNDAFGGATKLKVLESRVAMRRHDNQIHTLLLCELDYLVHGLAEFYNRFRQLHPSACTAARQQFQPDVSLFHAPIVCHCRRLDAEQVVDWKSLTDVQRNDARFELPGVHQRISQCVL